MAEPEQTPEPTSETAPPPPAAKSPGRLVTILLAANTALLLVVVVLVAFLTVKVLRHPAPPHEAAAVERAPAAEKVEKPAEKPAERTAAKGGKETPGAMVRLADFVVHLRDPDADRYARMSFEVELPDDKAKEAFGARLPQVRDAFLAFLSDRTTEELRGSEAMARVKGALVQKLSEVAPNSGVRGLYLTELVVQ